jgi:hypothetical protein
VSALKENSKQTMDSIYTTNKEYTDGTTLVEVKTVYLEGGTNIIVDGKPKMDTKTTININWDDKWSLILLIFTSFICYYGLWSYRSFLSRNVPAKIRYTSMSLPYHVGNGIFGGLLPAISTYLVINGKDNDPEFYLEGLWYPIIIATVCFAVVYIKIKILKILTFNQKL